MKKSFAVVVAVAVAGVCQSVCATEYEFTVDEGETKTLSEMVTAQSIVFQDGDWIVKKGLGTLKNTVTTFNKTNLNIRVEEGVYYISGGSIHVATDAELVVKSGATFNTTGSANGLSGYWRVSFEGEGAGFGNNLGAICVGGSETNPLIGMSNPFTMTGNATIYSYGTMNAMFSGSGSSSGPTLTMNGYTLTIRGKTASSVFRPRWKWTVKTPGPIVVRNGQFARHLTTNSFPDQVPRITFTEGAKMVAYNSDSLWKWFDSFEFDGTAVLDKGNGSPDLSTITMKELVGPAKITAAANVTVSERYLVHADQLVDGKFLSTTNTLTFADGAVVKVDNLSELPLSAGGTYTLADGAAGFAGTPALDGEATDALTLGVTDDGTKLVLTVRENVINAVADWGLAPGTNAAAANTAAIAAKLATLRDGDTVFFPSGMYTFDGGLDLSGLAAANVRFVGQLAGCTSDITLPPADKNFSVALGAPYFSGSDFILTVPADTTMAWSDVTGIEGFDLSLLSGKRFVKRGTGTFKPGADLSGLGLTTVIIEAGVWIVTANNQLGTVSLPVTVCDGATLVGNSNASRVIYQRMLNISGAGAPGEGGAIVFKSATYNSYSGNGIHLNADATLYSKINTTSTSAGTFHHLGTLDLNGHTLVLTAPGNGYSFRAARCFNPISCGTLVVSNVTFTSSAIGDAKDYRCRDGFWFHTILKSSAHLMPDTVDTFKVLNDVFCEEGTFISPNSSAVTVPLDYLGGVPSHNDNVLGYELKCGYVPLLGTTFVSDVPVTFKAGAGIDVRDRAALLAHAGETLTVLTATTVTGSPVAVGENRDLYSVTLDGNSVSITVRANIVAASALGLAPDNAAEANAAALATALAGMAADTTVLFEDGVYDFGEAMDLSSLAATGVAFVGTGKTAFKSSVTQPASGAVETRGITCRTAGDVYACVPWGETQTWSNVWQGAGWAASPTGVNLHKTGTGVFRPNESLHAYGLTVFADEGVMKTTASAQLGLGGATFTVANGATLWLVRSSGQIATSRTIAFAGSGAAGTHGAVLCDGIGAWNYTGDVTWNLTGDAVMGTLIGENEDGNITANGIFLNSSFDLQGHTLSICGRNEYSLDYSSVRVSRSCDWKSDGTIVFSRVAVSASDGDNCASYRAVNGATGIWRFENGAKFTPDDAGILNLFGAVTLDFAKGTGFKVPVTNLANKCACDHAAVGRLAGVPTMTGTDRTLSVTNQYTAHAADLVASNAFTYAAGTLAFERGSKIEIDGDLSTLPPLDLTLGTAQALTQASRLKSGTNLRTACLGGYVESNTLKVGTAGGLMILVR